MLQTQSLLQITEAGIDSRAMTLDAAFRWGVTLLLTLVALYFISTELGSRRRALAFWLVLIGVVIVGVWLTA